jgi:putative hemolysin
MGTILLVIFLILCTGFFSGIEIAFVSANRLKIELKKVQGHSTGRILSNFVKKTPQVITAINVGNNLALVLYGITIAVVLDPMLVSLFGFPENADGGLINRGDTYKVLLATTAISTFIILIFGEYIPKAIFRLNPDAMLNYSAHVLNIFFKLMTPFVAFINALSNLVLKRIFRFKYEEEELEFGKKDLDLYIQEVLSVKENPVIREIDAEMFSNALEFNTIRARESMVPRTEIASISIEDSIENLIDLFIETSFSRVIVYDESLDQILGYVHTLSMFRKPATIREVLQPVLIVPESMQANVILTEFTKNRRSVAIVVDEFGGTSGMITFEDLVEEVFGEIDDPHDTPDGQELTEKRIDENTWLLSARLEVDDLNRDHGLDLPYGDYNTIGGLVMHYAETIPKINQHIEIPGFRITVVEAAAHMVKTVKLKREPRSLGDSNQ